MKSLVIGSDVVRLPYSLRLSRYESIVDLAGISVPKSFQGKYERKSFPVDGIESSAYVLSKEFLSTRVGSGEMKNSMTKQLSLFRGPFFHLAVVKWYLSDHLLDCLDFVTGLSKEDLQILPIFREADVGRIIRTRFSSIYVDVLKQIGESLINRLIQLFRPNRSTFNRGWLFLAFTKTQWDIVKPLTDLLKEGQWSLSVRLNVLNQRKRAFVSWLKHEGIVHTLLCDYPGFHSFSNVWSLLLGDMTLAKLYRTAKREFERKVRFWEGVLRYQRPQRIIMLEEFLDTANVLNFVREHNNWDIKLINFMHGAGYYHGITPVDYFGVFGPLFKEKYEQMGNSRQSIVLTGTSAILPKEQARVYTLDDMDPLARHIAGRPVLTYFSQYNRGSSSEPIRSRIVSWLDEFCRNNNVALVIKLHPAEGQNIFTDCQAVVVRNEYPLELFFNISKVCCTFYSFAGIQAIFGGCPNLFINPEIVEGLYLVDRLRPYQYFEKDTLSRKLSCLLTSEELRQAFLKEQQKLLSLLFTAPVSAETIIQQLQVL